MIEKQKCNDLVRFGGTPVFAEPLHVGRPNIGDREALMGRLNDILDRRWLTNRGVYVREFEERVADTVGARHCIAMANGTVALEIAIRAAGLSGEVIVPSFTFIATAHALGWQEITPVFCDIDPTTHLIDPERVEALITPRTTGILGVHLWGHACDVERLREIADRRKLALLFDGAHAFGSCHHGGAMVGNLGDAEMLSFHATKFLNAFEGGAVLTNNDDLASRIRLMKNFGFAGYDDVIYIGTNGKMSEPSAAMGLTSLESMDAFIDVNRCNYEAYRRLLPDGDGLRLLPHEHVDGERCNYQYIVCEVDEEEAGIGRDEVMELLWAENVLARRYFYPGCHRMEPYRSYFPHAGLVLPQTELLTERVLNLPTGTAVGEEDIARICRLLGFILDHALEIRTRLRDAAVA
ncbi:MAG: DegT/DnrJ/EryC1/StrS family aminotransferase [Egibacteraceae bacterium]